MALVRCVECGGNVSSLAPNCPACGCPVSHSVAANAQGAAAPGNHQSIGDYELIGLLGVGGMGRVHRARHRLTHQLVALKELAPELASDPHLRERFVTEARVLARLSHPNLVRLLSFQEQEGRFSLAMELVEGQPLDEMLERDGKLSAERAVDYATQALSGLGHAHEQGVLHRDIKPSNLLVRSDGVVKVTDFGVAKLEGGQRLTSTGVAVGTVWYMSPEQIRGETADLRTDIYAMGVTLFEMLCGDPPFDSDSDYEVRRCHVEERAPDLSKRIQGLSPAITAAVARALDKRPERRFPSAASFAEALKYEAPAALIEKVPTPRPKPAAPRKPVPQAITPTRSPATGPFGSPPTPVTTPTGMPSRLTVRRVSAVAAALYALLPVVWGSGGDLEIFWMTPADDFVGWGQAAWLLRRTAFLAAAIRLWSTLSPAKAAFVPLVFGGMGFYVLRFPLLFLQSWGQPSYWVAGAAGFASALLLLWQAGLRARSELGEVSAPVVRLAVFLGVASGLFWAFDTSGLWPTTLLSVFVTLYALRLLRPGRVGRTAATRWFLATVIVDGFIWPLSQLSFEAPLILWTPTAVNMVRATALACAVFGVGWLQRDEDLQQAGDG